MQKAKTPFKELEDQKRKTKSSWRFTGEQGIKCKIKTQC